MLQPKLLRHFLRPFLAAIRLPSLEAAPDRLHLCLALRPIHILAPRPPQRHRRFGQNRFLLRRARVRRYRLPHRHASARFTNPARNGFTAAPREQMFARPTIGKLLNRPCLLVSPTLPVSPHPRGGLLTVNSQSRSAEPRRAFLKQQSNVLLVSRLDYKCLTPNN